MKLISRTTEYPNGVVVTEAFDEAAYEPDAETPAPYDQDMIALAEAEGESSNPAHTFEFVYHGSLRRIENAQIIRGAYLGWGSYNPLLGGFEVSKDGNPTGQYKNYKLDKIDPV